MVVCFFFFFNDTATTEIYTLSLHDALPISLICGGAYRSGCYGQWIAKGESRCQKLARFSFPGGALAMCNRRCTRYSARNCAMSPRVCPCNGSAQCAFMLWGQLLHPASSASA